MNLKYSSILLVIVTISLKAYTQISFEQRLEIELKDGYSNEEIIAFGNKGLILRSRSEKAVNNQFEWKYDLYDTDLQFVDSRNFMLDKKFSLNSTFSSKDADYTLFANNKGEYRLVTVEPENLELYDQSGSLPSKMRVNRMAVFGDYAYLQGSIKKSHILFVINWRTGDQKTFPIEIPGYQYKKLTVENFQILENSDDMFLYVQVAVEKKRADMYVVHLNKEGELIDITNFSEDIPKNIVTISASRVDKNEYIYSGTYSTKYAGLSEGLFFSSTQNGKLKYFRNYNFLDLKNFLSYLPEKRQEKILDKKEKKESKGKEFSLSYYIANHDVFLISDGYLFLGEAYYPTYRTVTYTSVSNGITIVNTYQVFDGYQYTHAILAKFNTDGELVWDQCFEMWPAYKPFTVKRFISVSLSKDESVDMVFSSYNRIVSKSVDMDGAVLKDKQSDEIQTDYQGDKSKRSFSNLDYWYDNYFLAYGNQKIINKEEKGVERKRLVYFINKIAY